MSTSRRRKPKPPPRAAVRPAPATLPAAGPPPTAKPHGQPQTTGRPLVTEIRSIIVVPQFAPGDPRAKLITGPRGGAGEYEVSFALAIPGVQVVQQEINFDGFIEQGDSLLAVADDVQELRVAVTDPADVVHTVRVGVNAYHRLRDLHMTVTASDFQGAAKAAHDIVMSLLSRWAYLHDVAITTSGMQLTEVSTQVRRLDLPMIGSIKAFFDTEGETDAEHRDLLATYREGLSSTDPLWQALSFYKVAEGVWGLRDLRRQAAKDAGAPLRDHGERVPDDVTTLGHPSDLGGVADALRPYAGKKYRAVFDDVRTSLRNAIAHLDPDADPLVQDNWDDVQRVRQLLPGLRWMSRQLLAAELHDAGQLVVPRPAAASAL